MMMEKKFFKNPPALTDVAQLVGCHTAKQKVTSSIPGQGTCLGCRPGPQLGCMQAATNQCFFSSLSPPPSL